MTKRRRTNPSRVRKSKRSRHTEASLPASEAPAQSSGAGLASLPKHEAMHTRSARTCFIVTGGAGFIGSNLVAALLSQEPGAHIHIVDNLRTGSYANIVETCERSKLPAFHGAIIPCTHHEVSWDIWMDELRPRAVFHLGAITDTTVTNEREMIEHNALGFESMARACHAASCPLVYASSAATYGTPPHTASKQPFPLHAAGKPNNVYGFSKWMLECEHRRFASSTPDAWIVGLRYFNVFGPGEARKGAMASMAYQLTQQCLAGKSPRLFAHGEQARDQVYVDDVVSCTLAAAGLHNQRVTPGIYNLGSGVATSFADVAQAVRRGLGLRAGQQEIEYFEMPAHIRAFYQDFTQADMSETEKGLHWKPKHGPVEAIEQYAKWMSGQTR
jgi:ADP-L-glycero-D-manno-heptose 6-epimerase